MAITGRGLFPALRFLGRNKAANRFFSVVVGSSVSASGVSVSGLSLSSLSSATVSSSGSGELDVFSSVTSTSGVVVSTGSGSSSFPGRGLRKPGLGLFLVTRFGRGLLVVLSLDAAVVEVVDDLEAEFLPPAKRRGAGVLRDFEAVVEVDSAALPLLAAVSSSGLLLVLLESDARGLVPPTAGRDLSLLVEPPRNDLGVDVVVVVVVLEDVVEVEVPEVDLVDV